MKKPEYLIASAVILGALLLTAVLAYSIGKLRYPAGQKRYSIWVTTAAGVIPNTQVKFAGAPIGRVESITVLARHKQEPTSHGLYCVQIDIAVDPTVEIGQDSLVSIRQDSLLGSSYISIHPLSTNSTLAKEGSVFKAHYAANINDLSNSGYELLNEMLPTVKNLNAISKLLNDSLPTLSHNINDLMAEADSLLKITTSHENKERITKLLTNLGVVTDNLKVMSTNAKALTSTLAQKPWRMIWGGPANPIPPESEILKSDKPIPIKNLIDVKPATN